MRLENIKLNNYRNHTSFETELDSSKVLIVGPNGAGKTNILEAINLLSTTKAYKAVYDRDAINHSESFARIEANIEADDDKDKLELVIVKNDNFEHASSKRVKVNGVAKTLHNFSTVLKTVLFSPEDISILTDAPARRRKYLDLILTQVSSEYKRSLFQYLQAVRQRNKLLEQMCDNHRGYDQIQFWDEKILKEGIFIQDQRKDLFRYFENKVIEHGDFLDGHLALSIKYKVNEMSENRLELYREKEINAKSTLIGPHRDDFELATNNYSISHFGSRGQQRTTLLALKLSEIDFFMERTGQRPILLLDDVFSELDENHKDTVFNLIDKQQTIITSTDVHPEFSGYQEIRLG